MATYKNTSPWKDTQIKNNYLGILRIRTVPAESDDYLYTIEPQYNFRPDLLAYDLYGDANLWWVFAMRNPNVLKNPIADFFAGQIILLPKQETLKIDLGL